jgi:hypothetical protein
MIEFACYYFVIVRFFTIFVERINKQDMKENGEQKQLGDGTKDFNWWINHLIALFTVYVTAYAFTALMVICGIIVGVCYIIMWWYGGYQTIILFLAGMFVLTWLSVSLSKHPEYKLFQNYRWLYYTIAIAGVILTYVVRFFGLAHYQYRLGLKWLWSRYNHKVFELLEVVKKMPLGKKLILATLVFVFLIPASYLLTDKTVETVNKVRAPYGKDRFKMTAEEMGERKQFRIKNARFVVWGQANSETNAECVLKYYSIIQAAAAKYNINPDRYLGLLMVEGAACDPDTINPESGAGGMNQIMVSVACEEGLIKDAAFCKTATIFTKVVPKHIIDGRLDPARSIPVGAKIIAANRDYWGNEDYAFAEYHMGRGNLRMLAVHYLDETQKGWDKEFPIDRSLVKVGNTSVPRIQIEDPNRSVPKGLSKYGITYDDIFFRHTPDRTPKTTAKLQSLSDSSSTYLYTGLAATEGLILKRTNPKEFQAMVKDQKDPDGGYANMIKRSWFSDKEAKFNDINDLKAARKLGELVPVPNDPRFGFVLRTTGPSRIAQCDAKNAKEYYYLKKATLGALYLLGARVKEYGGDPIEITGLMRTNAMYEGCLPKTQPRPHVMGVAFDVGQYINGKPKSKATLLGYNFGARDMGLDGIIAKTKEDDSDHFDVNPDPLIQRKLEKIVDEVNAGNSPLPSPTDWFGITSSR